MVLHLIGRQALLIYLQTPLVQAKHLQRLITGQIKDGELLR